MEQQILTLMVMIRQKLPFTRGTIEAAALAVVQDLEAAFGQPLDEQQLQNIATAKKRLDEEMAPIQMVRRLSIHANLEHWYNGPSFADCHWPALKDYLSEKGWSPNSIQSIDTSSTEIVGLLANPARNAFSHKGLVVGYVQSGKTANMTAVIAKAVDVGYNFVIILAGMTNKLRAQTQRRIDADIRQRYPTRWVSYTSVPPNDDNNQEGGDFVIPPNGHFQMPHSGIVQYAVVKKVPSPLQNLLAAFSATPRVTLESMRVLLIDDECDQASVNAANDENGITRINELIRQLIGTIPACAYVGYTATPFANVFINPYTAENQLDDLYPAHFITALPKPEGYVGTVEVFGSVDDGPEESDSETKYVRKVPDEEVSRLRPRRAAERERFIPEVTGSLKDALRWFILSCAIRRQRGQEQSHMTMLVHTSAYVLMHERMSNAIKTWLETLRDGEGNVKDNIWHDFSATFDAETKRMPLAPNEMDLGVEALRPSMKEVLKRLKVVVENGDALERLDYENGPKTYIVVGGSVLARGLTLEGLCVSFFLRTSRQYDTLLQMGRWFGFRKGYSDLPRLWSTGDLNSAFRGIGRVEQEIRGEINKYRTEPNITPLTFAVRVRRIPGLAITSAARMRAADEVSVSYAGLHQQTIRFKHKNREVLERNWQAVGNLVGSLAQYRDTNSERLIFRNVKITPILSFLKAYDMAEHCSFSSSSLIGYIEEAGERLSRWNVAFIGPADAERKSRIIEGFKVGLNRRSKLIDSDEKLADIKALMSKQDVVIDVNPSIEGAADLSWEELKERRPRVPLLLLYPIDKESAPMPGSKSRTNLDAVDDILGLGVVLPGIREEGGEYFAVNLQMGEPNLINAAGQEPEDP